MPHPLPLLVAGLVALVAGMLVLRTFGTGYRVGRILAATPEVPLAEAGALAEAGRRRYVRVSGRIDARDEFEDESGRPLVLHRVRTEARSGRSWRLLEERRRAVPFGLDGATATLAVDVDALDIGLVVIPRESVGAAGDLPDAFPDLAPATTVRLRVEQVSSVDHAVACGVPRLGPDGTPLLGPGLGRPLILTTLDRAEAMRVLAGGERLRSALAAGALGVGTLLVAAGLLLGLLGLAAPPDAAAAGSVTTGDAGAGDTRSPGTPPAFVGDPLLAIAGVLGIGVGTVGLTLIVVRLTAAPPD